MLFLVLIRAVQWYRYENNSDRASQFHVHCLLQINGGICFSVVPESHFFISGMKVRQSVSFFSIIALRFSLVKLRNEASGSMTSARAQKDTALRAVEVSTVAIGSCTSDLHCSVT